MLSFKIWVSEKIPILLALVNDSIERQLRSEGSLQKINVIVLEEKIGFSHMLHPKFFCYYQVVERSERKYEDTICPMRNRRTKRC